MIGWERMGGGGGGGVVYEERRGEERRGGGLVPALLGFVGWLVGGLELG